MDNTIERIKKEIKDWQADIHDNEYDADKFDFVFDRILEIIDEELAKEPQVCEWKLFDEDMNAYDTSCGESFYLTDGTPNENKMQYCPYCSGKVKVIE